MKATVEIEHNAAPNFHKAWPVPDAIHPKVDSEKGKSGIVSEVDSLLPIKLARGAVFSHRFPDSSDRCFSMAGRAEHNLPERLIALCRE